jgi:hypothetical protein
MHKQYDQAISTAGTATAASATARGSRARWRSPWRAPNTTSNADPHRAGHRRRRGRVARAAAEAAARAALPRFDSSEYAVRRYGARASCTCALRRLRTPAPVRARWTCSCAATCCITCRRGTRSRLAGARGAVRRRRVPGNLHARGPAPWATSTTSSTARGVLSQALRRGGLHQAGSHCGCRPRCVRGRRRWRSPASA